ncbi:MAG: hypothetical protein AMJ42_02995 [Deltaproteobacteria bacterium DG_8]|nr:MAG: hypothetical protein AMJ42_02995 [Deltaproteobacteria bacterium DG_8]
MSEGWYEIVNADIPITQGDIIFNCPLIGWKPHIITLQGKEISEVLKSSIDSICADVVVLTQACDIEHHKVDHIILCPHQTLDEYQTLWEEDMKNKNQASTSKAWRRHCDDICDGFIWNLTMLNSLKVNDFTIDIRIVDFHYVFTIPRIFLESLLEQRNEKRFRLLPPYREHLSQAFARFFMRVGLPIDINKNW